MYYLLGCLVNLPVACGASLRLLRIDGRGVVVPYRGPARAPRNRSGLGMAATRAPDHEESVRTAGACPASHVWGGPGATSLGR